MNQSQEISHSNLLAFSDLEAETTSQRYEQFINQLNPIDSIPQVQMNEISTGHQQAQKQETTTQLLQTNSSLLDYVDKLALNHNILKELLHMIDSKVTFRYEKTIGNICSNNNQLGHENKNDKIEQNNHQKQNLKGKMEEKMIEIRQRLSQTIELINKELSTETGNKIKKIIAIENIRENPSEVQLSLQYSHEFQYSESKRQNFVKSLKSKPNLQQEKENQIKKQEKKNENMKDQEHTHITENIKQSLKRRREMQSGDGIENVLRPEEVTCSLTEQIVYNKEEIQKVAQSNQQINKSNIKQIYQQNGVDDDETGRIIRSTINKKKINTMISPTKSKIIRSSILSPISQTNSESEEPNDSNLVIDIKKNKFWKDRHNNLQFYNKKTVVSHEQIEQSKMTKKPFHKETFKFEKKRSKQKLESKMEPLHINQKYANKMRSVKQPVQRRYQQEKWDTFGGIESEQIQQTYFSRFPLPYTLPSRTDFNQLKKPELYQLKPMRTNIRQQKRENAPNFKQQKKVGPPRIFKPQTLITSQPNSYVDNRSYQLHQNGLPLQRILNNPQGHSITNHLHSNTQQKFIVINKSVDPMSPILQRIPLSMSRPVSLAVRPLSVRLKPANQTNNIPVRPHLRQNRSDLGPLLSLNKVQNQHDNTIRNTPLQQPNPSNPQFIRTISTQNAIANLLKVRVGNRKFNFGKANHINNNHIPKYENILHQPSNKPELVHRQTNSKSIIDHLALPPPVSKSTFPQQNRLRQISHAPKQFSVGSHYSSIKKQLQKIAETSEASIQNSNMKKNETNNKTTSNYQSPRTNFEANSPKLKKTGISITNQTSNRTYISPPNFSQ